MASPKWHLGGSLVIAGILAAFSRFLIISLDAAIVVAFGVLVDIDHFLQWRRMIQMLRAMRKEKDFFSLQAQWEKTEPPGHRSTNVLHTWFAIPLVAFFSWWTTGTYWPFLAYIIHLLIDSFDDGYYWKGLWWEAPDIVARIIPRAWRYNKRTP